MNKYHIENQKDCYEMVEERILKSIFKFFQKTDKSNNWVVFIDREVNKTSQYIEKYILLIINNKRELSYQKIQYVLVSASCKKLKVDSSLLLKNKETNSKYNERKSSFSANCVGDDLK